MLVSTSATNCLVILISNMISYMSTGMVNQLIHTELQQDFLKAEWSSHQQTRHRVSTSTRWHFAFGAMLARLQTWRALIFSRVCLSVCLWPALLPFNVDRFWQNLVTRTLLWSSLATTIMVQIGRRGTARRLFENFKKILKDHRIRISKFWSTIFCVCVSCVL